MLQSLNVLRMLKVKQSFMKPRGSAASIDHGRHFRAARNRRTYGRFSLVARPALALADTGDRDHTDQPIPDVNKIIL